MMNFLQVKRPSQRSNHLNPMLLPSILQKSFRLLNYSDLKSCRGVNKLWKEEASKLIKDKVIVTLSDWRSMEQFNRVICPQGKSSPDCIFNSARLRQNINLADKNLQTSLDKVAHLMRYLRVETKVDSPEWRLLLFDQFVNLTELHIHGPAPFLPIFAPEMATSEGKSSPIPSTSTSSPGTSTKASHNYNRYKDLLHLRLLSFSLTNRKSEDIFVRRFLRDFFSVAPNLQSLEWIKEDPFANDFQKTMFDCLMTKMKVKAMSHLEVFRCPSLVCGTKELKDIAMKGFPLKEFHIQISSDVSAHFLESFLEAHGGTLEILKLDFCPGTPLNVMVTAPISDLMQLREITLTEYKRSIGFVGCLPNLRKLTLIRTNIKRALLGIGWSFDNKEKGELSNTLEQLLVFNDYVLREQGNCTREIVLKLAHCFPNLKIVRLEGLHDSSMRHIFKSFPKLEELYAPGGTYSDEAFRSFTEKEQLSFNGSRSSGRISQSSAFDASHLKNLRTLELESMGLTDKFITQGIITWRSVKNLTIKYARISYQTLGRVLLEMDLHQLRLQFCTVLTDKVLEVADDPVEMVHDDDTLDLTYNLIQKWRFNTFKMLFVQIPY